MSLTEIAAPSAHSAPLDLGVLSSELDGGVASRAAIGLVVLATDQTMEHEFRALVREPGVAIYKTRVFNDYEITPETLRAIGPRIAPSVALILPNIPLHVVAFGCTSATMTLGEDAVFAENPQGAADCRMHDPGHRRVGGVQGAAREEHRPAYPLCAGDQ
jgi:maleate isomerase